MKRVLVLVMIYFLILVKGTLAAGMVVMTPAAYQVFQRNGSNVATITVSGVYSGAVGNIEARWKGGTWVKMTLNTANSTFFGSIPNQAVGQGPLEVRSSLTPTTIITVPYVGIGDVFIVAGQSNAVGYGVETPQTYSHPTLKAAMFGNDDKWRELEDPTDIGTGQVDMVSFDGAGYSAWPNFATEYMRVLNVPVAIIPAAKGGSFIASWSKTAELLPAPATSYNLYTSLVRRAKASGSSVKGVLWLQGENEASQGMAKEVYFNSLNTLVNNLVEDLPGVKVVIGQIGDNKTLPLIPSDNLKNIRMAQIEVATTNKSAILGPALYDVPLSDDLIHMKTDAALKTIGLRFARAALDGFFGGVNDGIGPRIKSAVISGDTILLTFTDKSLPLVVPQGVGGIVVTQINGGQRIGIKSISLFNRDTLKLILTNLPNGEVAVSTGMEHWYSFRPVTDNSVAKLPLQPFADVLAVSEFMTEVMPTDTPTKVPTKTPTKVPTKTPTSGLIIAPTTIVKIGDADKNGMVNIVDFAIWKNEYLNKTGVRSDFNRSGTVDMLDFMLWKQAYLK